MADVLPGLPQPVSAKIRAAGGHLALAAIAGSHAYGMATPESDVDYFGVFVCPLDFALSLPALRRNESIVLSNHPTLPDYQFHEVGKFCHLAAQNNPTVLELMWFEQYLCRTSVLDPVLAVRDKFLSQHAYHTFGGYAMNQMKSLVNRAGEGKTGASGRTKNRPEKHARHCFRLLRHCRQLLASGEMRVKVDDPEDLFAIGHLVTAGKMDEVQDLFTKEMAKLDDALATSKLRHVPDLQAINTALLEVRYSGV